MGRRRKTNFETSARFNNSTFNMYYNRMLELAYASIEWKNLPETVDERYLEISLNRNASAIFFKDPVIGEMALTCLFNGNFDAYGNPVSRRAYSYYNNYQKVLDDTNSVIIWNNFTRTPSITFIKDYALRLYNIDRTIDVNVNAQKTPVLVTGTTEQRLTLINLYKEYEGNAPVIFGDKNLDLNSLGVLKTDAPYISDKLYDLKTQLWNEYLTYLGITNVSYQKRERLISDEVMRGQGGTVASRWSRLAMRQKAVDEINKMFNLDIEVDFRGEEEIESSLLTPPGGNNPESEGGVADE